MQVVIKPVPTEKWHGKDGKESFARPQSFEVLLDSDKGRYATGLSQDDINWLRKMGVNLDLSDTYIPDQPHPYWGSNAAKIKLPNHTMIMDDEKPLEFIKIKNMKASKLVANSLKEYEEGLWPEATHIIFDESEETELKATKVQNRTKCTVIASKMSTEEKTNVVRILSEKSVAGRSVSFIDVEIDDIIQNKTDEFIALCKMDKAELTTRAQLHEALFRNVLTKEGNAIYYMGEKLGFDFEDTLKYFMQPDNQQIKISILEKLNS